jgi:predicted ATPase
MLKRLYVDNFRCLVNFELRFDRVNLLLGGNGSGKTSVFAVLYRLQQFLAGNYKTRQAFPARSLTRWQANDLQRFELELQSGDSVYAYSLVIEHDADRRNVRTRSEILLHEGEKLFHSENGTVALYRDNHAPGPVYPFNWSLSGVGMLEPSDDNKKLTRFRNEMQKIIIASPHPWSMTPASVEDDNILSRHMENFVSWYRFHSQEHQGAVLKLFQELKEVIPGFDSFSLKEAGEAKVLKVLFDAPGSQKRPMAFDFSELSDGQKVLAALYALLFLLKDEGYSLFLDEPDNFVALREIQPWLTALMDACGDSIEQAILISHHPEIIDHLALRSGRWFDRDNNGPARVTHHPKAQVEGLTASETVARGWEA